MEPSQATATRCHSPSGNVSRVTIFDRIARPANRDSHFNRPGGGQENLHAMSVIVRGLRHREGGGRKQRGCFGPVTANPGRPNPTLPRLFRQPFRFQIALAVQNQSLLSQRPRSAEVIFPSRWKGSPPPALVMVLMRWIPGAQIEANQPVGCGNEYGRRGCLRKLVILEDCATSVFAKDSCIFSRATSILSRNAAISCCCSSVGAEIMGEALATRPSSPVLVDVVEESEELCSSRAG